MCAKYGVIRDGRVMVLILVLVEVGLRASQKPHVKCMNGKSLNPCFSGSWSACGKLPDEKGQITFVS